jgi:hypothetical protein
MEKDTAAQERIRERAFQIWIEEGQPIGRDKEHWALAEAEMGFLAEGSSPLQLDQPIGEIKRAQERLQEGGARQAKGDVADDTIPDDVIR